MNGRPSSFLNTTNRLWFIFSLHTNVPGEAEEETDEACTNYGDTDKGAVSGDDDEWCENMKVSALTNCRELTGRGLCRRSCGQCGGKSYRRIRI